MGMSTWYELNKVLLGLNQAVLKNEVIETIEDIDKRISFLQANRKRIAGSGHYGSMNHSFKLKGHKNYDAKLSDQYDDMYYEIVRLKAKKTILEKR